MSASPLLPLLLADDARRPEFFPFAYTRPVWDLRCGIYTFAQRWNLATENHVYPLAMGYLEPVFGTQLPVGEQVWLVNARLAPTPELLRLLAAPVLNTVWADDTTLIAACFSLSDKNLAVLQAHAGLLTHSLCDHLQLGWQRADAPALHIASRQDFFLNNAAFIAFDVELAARRATFQPLRDPHSRVYGSDNLFIEEGVDIKAAIINAESGPVYIGKGAVIQEGSMIHGAHAICDHATVNMGAKLRGDSTVGPYSKVGGELSNSVLMGYSNKGHDGFVGNSVLGYWCNLGADTNTSNLKNNYANVKLWSDTTANQVDTGLLFCGLMMGDHSKSGINTMFNTGTVVGVGSNIFGGGFPPTHVPSFAWGGADGLVTHRPDKMLETARAVYGRRKMTLSASETQLLEEVYRQTAPFRGWEVESK